MRFWKGRGGFLGCPGGGRRGVGGGFWGFRVVSGRLGVVLGRFWGGFGKVLAYFCRKQEPSSALRGVD